MWLEIESAPKDGTSVLTFWPDGSLSISRWITNSRMEGDRVPWTSTFGTDEWSPSHFLDHGELDDYDAALAKNQPTHWMPLPAPPTP